MAYHYSHPAHLGYRQSYGQPYTAAFGHPMCGGHPAFAYGHPSFDPYRAHQLELTATSGYSPKTVQEAWDNHFSAFGAQDLDKIMLDYDENSVLTAYEHTEGALTTATGATEIRAFFEGLFGFLGTDLSTLEAPVVQVTEGPNKQVYLIWKCPGGGVASAQDTFIFDRRNKISRQNIAWSKA